MFYFDLHCHSIASDDSRASVEQYLKWIKSLRKKGSKIDGIVCSPQELSKLEELNKIKVVPGIRNESSGDDQKRTMSSTEAYKNGADFIVVGRPITQAENIKT